jgi:branched-chain amino acid transport system permease protein
MTSAVSMARPGDGAAAVVVSPAVRRPAFWLPFLVTVALAASSPLWLARVGLYPYLALEILVWAIYALAFNLLLGYGGLPSFGHGAFFGVGAYAFGLFAKHAVPSLWLSLVAAAAAAACAGALVALFISHRRGIYYALLTIAFGQIAWFVSIKWHSVTGGEDGLLNIPRLPADFGVASLPLASNTALFYFALAVFVVVCLFLWRLIDSPFGRVLQAVKQNEQRAAYAGHAVWRVKFTAFVLSCTLSGVAGALFAMTQNSAYPNVMSLHNSGYVVMMVLIGGGLVSFWGPVIGALFFILARDVLGAATETWLLWYGLLFIAIVLFKPEGIVGLLRSALVRWRKR